ncbi:MAG TPA: glycosyltransferase family 9 protein [Planctomycetaceae bacterium]|jgi:lipopolysaccharide heptosyltransferase I|nr:glycosyltransferase family 9 protein [Planctomycetaceae bacterium]
MSLRLPASEIASITARRICIIKPSALGDVVQSLPLLPALRRRFPEATIDWVINGDFAGLLDGHPELANVIPFDRRGSWRDFVRLLRHLRQRQYDLVFDLQGLLRSAIMTLATGAPYRVGLETAREGAGWASHVTVPGTARDIPAHQRFRAIVAALGAASLPSDSGLFIPAKARAWARETLQSLPRPILAIHAGAGWETKRWPAEKFAEVAGRFSGSVVAVGSRGEAALAARIVAKGAGSGRSALDLAGATNLSQLAAVLENVDVMLSNDSGPLHLAAAAGTPVVGIFTCTSPVISGPSGSGHELVTTTVPCAASYCKRCPQRAPAHMACLQEVSVERVAQAVERICERLPMRRHSA